MYKLKSNLKHTYLTCKVGRYTYAIESEMVRNMLGVENILVKRANEVFVKNKINVRKKEVSVIDLRKLFAEDTEITQNTCIVVLEMPNTNNLYGFIVDMVISLTDIPKNYIISPEVINYNCSNIFINKLINLKEETIEVLDIQELVSILQNNYEPYKGVEKEFVLNNIKV